MKSLYKILKEPLLHFILLAGVLFVVYGILNPQPEFDENEIVMTQERILSISSKFAKKWNRAPTDSELKSLIDQYILTEAYYKEALKLGLDKSDPMIKRRMRQKMEFFTSDALSLIDVEDETLKKYLQKYPEKFTQDARYTFEQIYINPNKHLDNLKEHINTIRQSIHNGEDVVSDSLFLERYYKDITSSRLRNEFGDAFVQSLDTLSLDDWSESIESGLGVHFVKMKKVIHSKLYTLDEAREAVLREYMYEKRKEIISLEQQNILNKYRIKIDIEETVKSEVE